MPVQQVGVNQIILAIEKAYAISYAENSDQLGLIFQPESLVAENKRKIFNKGNSKKISKKKKQTLEIKREIKEKYQRKIFSIRNNPLR